MLNLIGCNFNPEWLGIDGIQVHWYGKSIRPGRKMGHINIRADSASQFAQTADHLAPLLDTQHRAFLHQAVSDY
jgi:5-(carboxyamino)imidazole ribonucleotide synthase